jgi:hypothetical protein
MTSVDLEKKEILTVIRAAQHQVTLDANQFASAAAAKKPDQVRSSLHGLHNQFNNVAQTLERRIAKADKKRDFYKVTVQALQMFTAGFQIMDQAQTASNQTKRFTLLGQALARINKAQALQRKSEAALGGKWRI